MVFGKALTNGLNPLSGIWAREELIGPDKFGPGSTHSTFSSNSMGTAAGLEVMKIFKEGTKDGSYEQVVPQKGAYFLELLKDLQKKKLWLMRPKFGRGIHLQMPVDEFCRWFCAPA